MHTLRINYINYIYPRGLRVLSTWHAQRTSFWTRWRVKRNVLVLLVSKQLNILFLTSNRQKLSNTGYIKGEASRLLRTKSEENLTLFKQRLRYRGYLDNLIDKTLSEVNFSERMSALQNKQKTRKNILPFVTEYRPSVPDLKPFRWLNGTW